MSPELPARPPLHPSLGLSFALLALALSALVLLQTGCTPASDDSATDPSADVDSASADVDTAADPADEARLLFYSDRTGNGDLYVFGVPLEGAGQGSVPAVRLTTDEASEFAPRWDRARDRLVYTLEREGGNVLVARTADGSVTELFPNPAADEAPDWSPEGQVIVYSEPTDPADIEGTGPRNLVLADALTGERLHALTATKGREKQPVFSPDGRRIAFTSDRDGNQEIYVLTLDADNQPAGEPVNLTNHPALEGHPAWSPDGGTVLFYRWEKGDADLYAVPSNPGTGAAGTGEAVSLSNQPGNELVGTYSPDGEWITFGSARDDDWEIYRMAADGTAQQRLTNRPGFDGNPLWVPSSVLGIE